MKRIALIILGLLLSYSGFSQEIRSYVISSSGASIMGDNGSLYLSIGEPMNTEISDGEIMISQGFLQVSISESTSTENFLTEEIKVYPNPTGADLIIEMPELNGVYKYQLFNSLGDHIENKEIQHVSTPLDLEALSPGNYFLRVIKGKESSRTVKIVKL